MPDVFDTISAMASNDAFLEDMITLHDGRILVAIEDLRNNITNALTQLKTDAVGRLEGPKVNLKQTQQLHKQLVKEFEKEYNVKVKDILGDFSKIDKQVEKSYKELDEAIKFTNVDKTMLDTLRDQTYAQYVQFGDRARDDIASAMYSHVIGGAKFSTLENTIRGILTGHKDARGRPMTQYTTQFANDSIMNYHNQVNLRKGEEAGMKHFLYYGDIIGTSRQFCIQRVGKIFTKRQIGAWDRLPWAGKAGGAYEYRGGYNCRHHWQPIRKEWIEEDEQYEKFPIPNEDKEEKLTRGEIVGYMMAGSGDSNASQLTKQIKQVKRHQTAASFLQNAINKKLTGGKFAMAGKVPKDLTWALKQKQVKEFMQYAGIKKLSNTAEDLALIKKFNTDLKKELSSLKTELKNIGDDAIKTAKTGGVKPKPVPKPKKIIPPKPKVEEVPKFHTEFQLYDKDALKYVKNIEFYGAEYDSAILHVVDPLTAEIKKITGATGKLQGILEKNPLTKIRVYNDYELPKLWSPGTAAKKTLGMYSSKGGSHYISISAKELHLLNDAPDLVIGHNNFSVGIKSLGTFRHEFGHHVYNVGVKGKMKAKWATLYKEKGSQWFKDNISMYAGTSADEAFAECFGAYMNPKYGYQSTLGTQTLPNEVSEYFSELFTGKKLKPVIKPKPKLSIPKPKPPEVKKIGGVVGGRKTTLKNIFKEKADQKEFDKWKAYYDDYLASGLELDKPSELAARVRDMFIIDFEEDFNFATQALRAWKGDTRRPRATALKILADRLEAKDTQVLIKRSEAHQQAMKYITPENRLQYIKMRALTQAYYDKLGVETVQLHRGTDGNTGRKLRQKWGLLKNKDEIVEIEETALTGYSSSFSEALNWGKASNGVTVSLDVSVRDILIPYDIWPKSYSMSELEYIVVSAKRSKIKMRNVNLKALTRSEVKQLKGGSEPLTVYKGVKYTDEEIKDMKQSLKEFGVDEEDLGMSIDDLSGYVTVDVFDELIGLEELM